MTQLHGNSYPPAPSTHAKRSAHLVLRAWVRRVQWSAPFFQGRSANPLFGAGPFPIFVLAVLWPPPLMSTAQVFLRTGTAASWYRRVL